MNCATFSQELLRYIHINAKTPKVCNEFSAALSTSKLSDEEIKLQGKHQIESHLLGELERKRSLGNLFLCLTLLLHLNTILI